MRGRTKEAEELWKQVHPFNARMLHSQTQCYLRQEAY